MSIRLRRTSAGLVAICAARSLPKDGDIYLDDESHHALSVKFDLDFGSEGLLKSIYVGSEEAKAIEVEESTKEVALMRRKKETDEEIRDRFKYTLSKEEIQKTPISELRRRLRAFQRSERKSKQ